MSKEEVDCNKCGKKAQKWNDWILCDNCGYRYNIVTNLSPDDKTIIRINSQE